MFSLWPTSVVDSLLYNPLNWALSALLVHVVHSILFPKPVVTAPLTHPTVIELRPFTPKELSYYDGKEGRPIYMAVSGMVFDVSAGRSFYGPGSMYENFSGRDASRGMALNSFDDEVLSDISGPIDALDNLTPSEIESLNEWTHFYLGK
ncbi:hypothetical protein BSLG_008330 [Batrachochytrium salamandrivorans]|nr:hypothetical protein BSLG_008330 [Batrachochytrium salamandrivorans]